MHPKKPKGLSLGLGFQFFEYFGLGLGIYKSLANFELDNLNTKKNLFLGMDLSTNFEFFFSFSKFIIHTQKLNFSLYLNYLIRNLQEI